MKIIQRFESDRYVRDKFSSVGQIHSQPELQVVEVPDSLHMREFPCSTTHGNNHWHIHNANTINMSCLACIRPLYIA